MSTSTGISLTPAPYWPNVYTTGVPIGTTLTVAGSNTINAPGTYDSLDFTGFVTIAASNVTLTNSRIRAIASDPWSLEVNGTQTNVLVKNVTIIGASNATTTGGATYGFYVSGNSGATFDACNISHVGQNAINNGNVLVKNCYIHELISDPTSHYECIYYGGAGGANPSFSLDLEHNTFMNANNQTASVYIENFFGVVNNVTVNNNLIIGGDFSIYVEGNQNPNNITNVTVTNNAMGAGIFGYTHYDQAIAPVYQVIHTNNYDWITGVAIP